MSLCLTSRRIDPKISSIEAVAPSSICAKPSFVAMRTPVLLRRLLRRRDISTILFTSMAASVATVGFLRIVRDLIGNFLEKAASFTFPDVNWLASIVVPHQPHFIGQPEDVGVFWGYGLHVDEPGNGVKKSMSACGVCEIITELLGHLHSQAEAANLLESCICIHDAVRNQPVSPA
jgi:hypothetical protein